MGRAFAYSDPRGLSPEAFLQALARIPWFRHLGEPDSRDQEVVRIRAWHEWPGPQSPECQDLGPLTQDWHDAMMADAGSRRAEAQAFWDRALAATIDHARGAVPFDPDQDSWHGPTTAVWHAAWVAATVGCCLLLGREVPPAAHDQWGWLAAGHWPCGFVPSPVPGEPARLLVL